MRAVRFYGTLRGVSILIVATMSHVQADRVQMVANPHLIGINIPGFTRDFSDFINGFMNS